jgi:hypothetical protein
MPAESEPVLPLILITSLEEAMTRFAAAAHLHTSIEPSLLCRRAPDGRRRWELVVNRRVHGPDDAAQAG